MCKRPNKKENIASKKQPQNIERVDEFYLLPPKWSFLKIDAEHLMWGLECNSGCLVRLIKELRDLERLGTWGNILRLTNGRDGKTRKNFCFKRAELAAAAPRNGS